jgi:signal transduction histidine kinase
MCVLIRIGALPLLPTPFERLGAITTAYFVTLVAAFAVSMLAPGAYIAIIVQRLRQKETALEERARDLVEASKEKGQFMVNVTHELRTPLHGILGLSELLREGIYGPVTAKQIEGIAGIVYSAKNLLELIDALLLFARAEVTKLDVVVTAVAIGEVATRVAATGRWLCGTKKLSIDVSVDPELPVVDSDRARVTHILVNLLANAIKFTPEGGRVDIAARRAGDGVELVVSDTGIGIPERELERIFQAFHQVDGSAERAHGGVGLGLALVRQLAHAIEASVAVESTEGKGSTFTVRLPSRMAKSPRVQAGIAELPRATANGEG